MTSEENQKARQYFRPTAIVRARELIEEFRRTNEYDKDPELNGPAPFPLFVETLLDMHMSAMRIDETDLILVPGFQEMVDRWRLPSPPLPTAKWVDPDIISATQEILKGIDAQTIHLGTLPHILRRVFDAGREAGMDQEARNWNQRLREEMPKIDMSNMRAFSEPAMSPCVERPAARAEFTREPAMMQCGACSGAVYSGEEHHCPANQAKTQGFRSFGDRRG